MSTRFESITPTDFQSPDQLPTEKKSGFKPLYLVIFAALLIVVPILYFMLSAKAVLIRVNIGESTIEVTEGLALPIGDSHLLLPGNYRVDISAAGYEPISAPLVIDSDTPTEIRYELTPLPGDLKLNLLSADTGAVIHRLKDLTVVLSGEALGIDEQRLLATPDHLLFEELPAGSYTLTIDLDLYAEQTLDVEVPGLNQTHEVEISMQPDWGWVQLSTNRDDVRISADGMLVEQEINTNNLTETVTRFRLETGDRTLALEADGYKPVVRYLDVLKNQELDLGQIDLLPVDSQVSIQTDPAGAAVTVNQDFVGETPLVLDLAPDTAHQISLFKAGFEGLSDSITVERNAERALNYKLEPDLVQVSVSLFPENASLQVNGREITNLSRQLSLPAIQHQVQVSAPGYESQQLSFLPVKGTRQHLQVRLMTNEEAVWAKIPPTYSNVVGQEMKLFREPGEVSMGSSRRETGRRANEAPWNAVLRRPFYVSLTEVTNRQYKTFQPEHSSGNFLGNSLDGANQPVVNISWQQAALYCNWLSEQEGLTPFYMIERGFVSGADTDATGYRLLTETEWSWLAVMTSSGLKKKYIWGDEDEVPGPVENYADRSAAAVVNFILELNDNYTVSSPVGSFSANEKGIFDLSGNVNEWMHDWYEASPYDPNSEVTDPLGPEEGEFHVIRGASWARGYLPQLRLAYRDYDSTGRNDLGFRVARYAM